MQTRWMLVAGTGKCTGLSEVEVWSSTAIGVAVANAGYGLVVGGWHGVDYISSEAFARTLNITEPSVALSDMLLQVVPRGQQPVFQGGRIVAVDPGPAEWVEALRFADACVLVGGIGGTYRTYAHAMQERRAVFPLAASRGDAATVFGEIRQRWHANNAWGVSQSIFERVLGRSIGSQAEAHLIAQELMLLLSDHFAFQDREFQRNKLFISYARIDRDWLVAVRTQLRSMPDQAVNVWDDSQIPPGADFEHEIQRAISGSRASLLIVTPAFLASDFIRNHELPFLVSASDRDLIRLFWIHARKAQFEDTPLAAKQAAHDPNKALATMVPSEQRECLSQICLELARFMRSTG
jgi:hypothetical protein